MIEVGRLWRCLDLLEVTSMSSVMLSLSLSMFAVAQALTSLIHFNKNLEGFGSLSHDFGDE